MKFVTKISDEERFYVEIEAGVLYKTRLSSLGWLNHTMQKETPYIAFENLDPLIIQKLCFGRN